jgi:hypothetical protein
MIFSPKHYRTLKKNLQNRYIKEQSMATRSIKKGPYGISHWVQDHGKDLAEYSALKWFFLQQLKSFHFLAINQENLSTKGQEFGETEDEVFERWNKSEFADVFLKALNKGKSFSRASQHTLKIFDEHLVALGDRQILKDFSVKKKYRPQVALGDRVKSGDLTRLLETTLHLEGKELGLMTSSLKEMKSFSHKIEIALKVIRKFSPSSWDRFVAFTDLIIPIHQKEFVSYSHQELPGVSMINLYDRDFVDLMDDLLHENGHHHLNHYLNLGKLIEEPLENIYFSPWRRTLRPLRGIYHAYFTFFWAFRLFSDLAKAKENDSIFYLFSPREKEKIIWRAVEEFRNLEFTFEDLRWANKKGLITTKGWNLVLEQRKEVIKMKKMIPVWERRLRAHRKDLSKLKQELKVAQKDYKKI